MATGGGCCRRKRAPRYPGETGPDVVDSLDRSGYVDQVAVERAASGHRQHLNRHEAEALVVRLSQRQMTLAVIQSHTGFSRSTIAAILARRREQGRHR